MTIRKYLLSSVLRSPEGEQGTPAATDQGQGQAAPEGGDPAEAFKFDPSSFFVPPAKEGSGEDGGDDSGKPSGAAPEGKDPEAGAASTGTGSTSPPASPEQAPKEGDVDLAALRDSVQKFLTKPAAGPAEAQPQPAQPQPAAAAPKPGETPAKDAGPKYEFDVPSEVVEALGAEEPSVRRKAVNGLLSGLANKLATDFGQAMAAMAQQVQQETIQAVLAHVNQQENVKTVRQDFYDNHKDLKTLVENLPALDGVIWQTANQIAQATGKKVWDAELREQVAATLKLQLGLVKPGEAPKPAPNGGARAPRSPSFSAGSSSSARPNGAADTNEYASVLRT